MDKNQLEFKKNLERLLEIKPVSFIAKDFGVSRQAVYKWLKKYKINYKDKNHSYYMERLNKLNETAKNLLK